MNLLIEGWRGVAHSYSLINQMQCLELLRRPNVKVFHRDLPMLGERMRPMTGLLEPEQEARLAAIPAPPADLVPDAVYRIGFPFDLSPSNAKRTVVFGTTEFGIVNDYMISGRTALQSGPAQTALHRPPGKETALESRPTKTLPKCVVHIVTPSAWSRDGFLRSGLKAANISIVPHGVDPGVFRPVAPGERETLRRELGWEAKFVFLNVGAMSPNKGIGLILRALAAIMEKHPQALLVLKGSDAVYNSAELLRPQLEGIPAPIARRMQERIRYIGSVGTAANLARYYLAADAYVSPYTGEGFNVPVLEAAACGLAVLCTRGGPTDEFTRDEFARRISSKVVVTPGDGSRSLEPSLPHLTTLMTEVMGDAAFRARAREAGPAFVHANYTWKHAIDRLLPVLA